MQKTTDAKEQTGIGQEKEIVALAYNSALAKKNGNGDFTAVTAVDLNIELADQGASADGKNTIIVTFENGHKYLIKSTGNIEEYYLEKRTGIKVGDYIDYEPTEGIYQKEKLYKSYTGTNYSGADLTTKVNNEYTVQKWRVLRIYDDGKIDIIGNPSSFSVSFSGATSYNNGVYVMHDICKNLYSNELHSVEARSVNLTDFEVEGRRELGKQQR